MPVQFKGLKEEHQAVRQNAGLFDISHMGMFYLKGKDLLKQLQQLVPSDLERLSEGKAQYTVLLNPDGGIIDDIIFYYQREEENGQQQGVMIVNAATIQKDKQWLLSHLGGEIVFEDVSQKRVLIALQGPKALDYLNPLVEGDVSKLGAFGHLETSFEGESIFVARTGYTGEDGFEIMAQPDTGVKLWRSLLEAGVVPCGLGARDTLRLEAGMCLYDQDIDDTTTPLEAGLGWLVHLDTKGDFIGREVLVRQKTEGVKRRLVGLEMQGKSIARHGYPLLVDGQVVGEVTSGTLAPTLGKAIALAYLPTSLSKIGQELEVEIRGKNHQAIVVKKPFYQKKRV
jgi:aminomethyltransferase